MRSWFMLALLIASISCAESQSSWNQIVEDQNQSLAEGSLQLVGEERFWVVDEHQKPVPGAQILVGYDRDNPFAGNLLETDASGVAFIPAEWSSPLPVTVQAPGYITLTFPSCLPGTRVLNLSRQEPPDQKEIKGTTTEYGRLIQDGKVDFSLVFPALNREQMLFFDLATVISPHSDRIPILGNSTEIPSNLALPQQLESYFGFRIPLNKPDYRSFVRTPGQYTISAIHGEFPLQRVISDIRAGKSFFEMINHFTFKQAGQRTVSVETDTANVDLPVNQIPFPSTINVRAPKFGENREMISLALLERGGVFTPTDLKRLTSGQNLDLKTNPNMGTPAVLSLMLQTSIASNENLPREFLRLLAPWMILAQAEAGASPLMRAPLEPDFGRLSFVLVSAQEDVAPQFLPLIERPVLNPNTNTMTFSVPQLPEGVVAAAMGLILSEIETVDTGIVKNERRTRLWEVWSSSWLEQVQLPTLPLERKADRSYRWEVLFLARPANFTGVSGTPSKVDLNTITHVTRNILDI
ncbi:MAG: hypothetical protein AB7G93_20640 [Bdellovibrionales bacterium]